MNDGFMNDNLQTVYPRLYILVGLPGSGKSTWARAERRKNPNLMIVNKDAIRSMLGGGDYFYDERLEPIVRKTAQECVVELLETGFDVCIDETNITKGKREYWLNIATKTLFTLPVVWIPKIVWFKETKNNLENRMKNPRGVSREKWESVIEKMRTDFEAPT